MSKARDEYYKSLEEWGVAGAKYVKNYVSELEQQKAELIEFVKWLDNIGGMGYYVHGKIDELLKKYSE